MLLVLLVCFQVFRVHALSTNIIPTDILLKSLQRATTINPHGLRLFHPMFPLSLLSPISINEMERIIRIKELTGSLDESLQSVASNSVGKFPWYTFPKIGIPDSNVMLSKSEILESFEKVQHNGFFLW